MFNDDSTKYDESLTYGDIGHSCENISSVEGDAVNVSLSATNKSGSSGHHPLQTGDDNDDDNSDIANDNVWLHVLFNDCCLLLCKEYCIICFKFH